MADQLVFFGKRSDGPYVSFSGMTQEEIVGMLAQQNLKIEFVDAATFEQATAPKG